MKIYNRIGAFILVLAMSLLFCSCGGAEPETAVKTTENPTETAAPAEDIKLMYYTVEIWGDMTAMVGESIELHAEVISDKYDESLVEWESSCESSLSIEPGEKANEAALKVLSTEKSPVLLTVSCGDIKKVFPVYIRPDTNGRESVQPGEIRLMFYNEELSEFTLREGETVNLHVEADGVGNAEFEWKSSDESCLTIEKFEDSRDAAVTAEQGGKGRFVLTVSCDGIAKDFTVYIVAAE